MPGDTTIINALNYSATLDSIQKYFGDSTRDLVDSLYIASSQYGDPTAPHYLIPQWAMFLVVLAVLAFTYFVYVRGVDPNKKWYQAFALFRYSYLLKSKTPIFDQLLKQYNPYYKALLPDQQTRFIKRLIVFMQSKNFHYHSITPDEKIPVLISGAAIQLTFGLRNFMLDYFRDIHVIGKEYRIPGDDTIYYGHVSLNGIHVAWNYFMEGYENYSDSVNVGLHEMAHALSFDCYLGVRDREDRKFKGRLDEFSEEGRKVFRGMRKGENHMLNDYATTNFDEFWAVSVESFFEDPMQFKSQMPELYREMSELLNQDPFIPGKVLDEKLS